MPGDTLAYLGGSIRSFVWVAPKPLLILQVDIAGQLLNKPEYFFCERAKCKLRVDICIARQKANDQRQVFTLTPFLICENCQQGAENKLLIKAEKIMEKRKPRRGSGGRFESCEFYNNCLDLAAKNNWKTFNCDSCPIYKPDLKKEKNTRVCEECKEKPTISPKHPLCASCLGKKGNKAQKAEKSHTPKSKEGSMAKDISKAEKRSQGQNTALTIDFGKHVQVLREVEKLADNQLRPIDLQVVFMLKNQLNTIKEGRAT